MRLILASQSPRRREILNFFAIPFEQMNPHFAEESVPFENDPVDYATTLSKGKAASVAKRFPQAAILAADTVVYHEGKIYNKPADEKEAFEMLSKLVGSWHSVFTSVTAQKDKKEMTVCEETRILFHPLDEGQIRRYHKAFHTYDKAGGYAIQMAGSLIVKRMEGCFYNVMGLPINALATVLKSVGIDLWEYLKCNGS